MGREATSRINARCSPQDACADHVPCTFAPRLHQPSLWRRSHHPPLAQFHPHEQAAAAAAVALQRDRDDDNLSANKINALFCVEQSATKDGRRTKRMLVRPGIAK
jgi:hypothetical protein